MDATYLELDISKGDVAEALKDARLSALIRLGYRPATTWRHEVAEDGEPTAVVLAMVLMPPVSMSAAIAHERTRLREQVEAWEEEAAAHRSALDGVVETQRELIALLRRSLAGLLAGCGLAALLLGAAWLAG